MIPAILVRFFHHFVEYKVAKTQLWKLNPPQ
jgi:hypothetical protein